MLKGMYRAPATLPQPAKMGIYSPRTKTSHWGKDPRESGVNRSDRQLMADQTAPAPTAIKLAVGLTAGLIANQWPVKPLKPVRLPKGLRSDRSKRTKGIQQKHPLWNKHTAKTSVLPLSDSTVSYGAVLPHKSLQ